MTIEMTLERWLMLLAISAVLMPGALGARPALSIRHDGDAVQMEQRHDGGEYAPASGRDEVGDD
jgi:hypothetical protein